MIKSMTGFARREVTTPMLRASIGLRSYNNRYLELSLSLPSSLAGLEPRLREYFSARIVHGKVEFWLRLRELESPVRARADTRTAKAMAAALLDIAQACGIQERPRLGDLLAAEGLLSWERDIDEDAIWSLIEPELSLLFDEYEASRLREGAAALRDIETQLGRVTENVELVKRHAQDMERLLKNQLVSRFRETLGDAVDEQRVLAETAVLLMKYTINEELSRLDAHIEAFRCIAGAEAAPGKKLDFLSQEMNREVNTIGSKNLVLPVSRAVVELKDAIENIREQLRNVE